MRVHVFTTQRKDDGFLLQVIVFDHVPTWEEYKAKAETLPTQEHFELWRRNIVHLQYGEQPHASFVTSHVFRYEGLTI